MIALRKAILPQLKAICPRVYYQSAPDDAIYPYLVYDFPNSFTSDEQEIFNLDVDVWDMPKYDDTTEIETIANLAWKKLHKFSYLDEDTQFTVHRENRLPPLDEDERLRRRKLIFQLRYFDRRLNDG